MAFTETFDADTGNYVISQSSAYEAALGNFAPGCVRLDEAGASSGGRLDSGIGETQVIAATDNFYFNYEITGPLPAVYVELRVFLFYNVGSDDLTFEITTTTPWTQFSFSLAARDGLTLEGITFEVLTAIYVGDPSGMSVYIDSITVSDTAPPLAGEVNYGFTRNAGGMPGSVMVS